MRKCALCKKSDADKKNTHYLTDGIIRTAINEDGSNEREKGMSVDLSNDNPYSEFSFQRNTSPEKIEEIYGRPATQDEIDKSKASIEFSVDNVFCTACEKKFTEIENNFCNTMLPKFRNNKTLENATEVDLAVLGSFRLFWLLQVWRTSVCVDNFELSSEVSEDLRNLIFQGLSANSKELKKYPLSVAFMYSGNDPKEYTTNGAGYSEGTPKVLFMNEFVIQFYESPDHIDYFDFYGLNDLKTYRDFLNCNEDSFKVQVLSSQLRKDFFNKMRDEQNVVPRLKFYITQFYRL